MNIRAMLIGAGVGVLLCFAALFSLIQSPSPHSRGSDTEHCAAALAAAERMRALPQGSSILYVPPSTTDRAKCAASAGHAVYQVTYDAICNASEVSCTRLVSVVSQGGYVTYPRHP